MSQHPSVGSSVDVTMTVIKKPTSTRARRRQQDLFGAADVSATTIVNWARLLVLRDQIAESINSAHVDDTDRVGRFVTFVVEVAQALNVPELLAYAADRLREAVSNIQRIRAQEQS